MQLIFNCFLLSNVNHLCDFNVHLHFLAEKVCSRGRSLEFCHSAYIQTLQTLKTTQKKVISQVYVINRIIKKLHT